MCIIIIIIIITCDFFTSTMGNNKGCWVKYT
jgi:hypothetical protein